MPAKASEVAIPEFGSSTTMARIQKRGHMRVAICHEQPSFCYAENDGDPIVGLEVDIANCIAKQIFGTESAGERTLLELVPITLAERADYVQTPDVDIVLGNYADTPERRSTRVSRDITYTHASHHSHR